MTKPTAPRGHPLYSTGMSDGEQQQGRNGHGAGGIYGDDEGPTDHNEDGDQ